jgi:hypothetical protein
MDMVRISGESLTEDAVQLVNPNKIRMNTGNIPGELVFFIRYIIQKPPAIYRDWDAGCFGFLKKKYDFLFFLKEILLSEPGSLRAGAYIKKGFDYEPHKRHGLYLKSMALFAGSRLLPVFVFQGMGEGIFRPDFLFFLWFSKAKR